MNCGNSYVRDAYALMSGKTAALRTDLSKQFADARAVSLGEHRKMIRSIDKGDFEGLQRLLQSHVGRTVDACRLATQSRQAPQDAPRRLTCYKTFRAA